MYPQSRTINHLHARRWTLLASILALVAASAVVPGANASTSTDELTVSARNSGTVSLTILGDKTINFGTNLVPTGGDFVPNGDENVYATTPGMEGNQGRYYVWHATEPLVQVQSNVPWQGTISASENCPGCQDYSTTMTIASGVLRFATNAQDAGEHPFTYNAAAGLPGIPPTGTGSGHTWEPNGSTGSSDHYHLFALRVDHDDAPGLFEATITYTATT